MHLSSAIAFGEWWFVRTVRKDGSNVIGGRNTKRYEKVKESTIQNEEFGPMVVPPFDPPDRWTSRGMELFVRSSVRVKEHAGGWTDKQP